MIQRLLNSTAYQIVATQSGSIEPLVVCPASMNLTRVAPFAQVGPICSIWRSHIHLCGDR
jgi:hypothetical protein